MINPPENLNQKSALRRLYGLSIDYQGAWVDSMIEIREIYNEYDAWVIS